MKLLSKYYLPYSILLLMILSCEKKKSNSELIIGEWIEISKVLIEEGNNKDKNKEQVERKTDMKRVFNLDGTYFVSYYEGMPYDTGIYYISKDTIFFEKNPYPLITLNDSMLIYKKIEFLGNSYYIEKFKKIR